jgi:hypothetical protein
MMQIVPRRRASPARETRRRQTGARRAHRSFVRDAHEPDAYADPHGSGHVVPAGMRSNEVGAGAPRMDPNTLPPMAEGVPMRDELLRRWAHVLLAQHGDGAARYVQERRRARAVQGDRVGVDDWTDVGAIICELMGLDRLPGDDSYLRTATYVLPPDVRAGLDDDDGPSSPWSEWTFWLILSVLMAGVVVLLLVARNIWTAL